MAKDPAFLFYPGDYLGGTMGFTFEQHGAYLIALLYQFNNGHFSETRISNILGKEWPDIKHKFIIDKNGLFYNKRLDEEKEKRATFCDSRRKSRLRTSNTRKTHVPRMEDENEDEDKDAIAYKNLIETLTSGGSVMKSEYESLPQAHKLIIGEISEKDGFVWMRAFDNQ
jgi:uncharacterized protein YdaU (DUF1376 family)